MGKIYAILMMIISSNLVIYLLFFNEIIITYNIYYLESNWGLFIATLRQIVYFEFNFIYILIVLIIIGFVGGLISRSFKNGIIVAIISGLIIPITWLIWMARFTPVHWGMSSYNFLFILKTLFRGFLIGFIYLGPCFLGGFLISFKKYTHIEKELQKIETICPNCQEVFKSNPIYCCYCNNKIREEELDSVLNNNK